ncbi:hypothetical protein PIB30_074722, partial [Stylosanthes scabra]|nr:hypothetical protein [Stylosanthes scabra]
MYALALKGKTSPDLLTILSSSFTTQETPGAETDYTTRQATDQRLDEVLAELCIPGATWKLSSSQPAVPIQLRRAELFPLARGWQEFIIHSLFPTGNKLEITVARAILIHAIMKGKEVRAEDIIADNMAAIAQGLHGKEKLGFPSTIYKLCKNAKVPLREFKRTTQIPQEKLITAKQMESTRLPMYPSSSKMKTMRTNLCLKPKKAIKRIIISSNTINSSNHHSSIIRSFSRILRTSTKSQAEFMEEVKAIKAKKEELWNNTNRFHSQIRKEQNMLAREIQEIGKTQINQTLISSQKYNAEKNLEQAVERQARELAEMKKQLNLWTRNASAREAYSCWAHQQANPNLSKIPINHIPNLMQTNAEKGRPMFHGALKSH